MLQCIGKRGCGRWFPRQHYEHGGRGKRGDATRLRCEDCYAKQIAPTNAIKARLRRNERHCAYTIAMRAEVAEIYRLAGALKSRTGKTHHVDHEVPLSGQNAERPICGLTVPANLRVMPAHLDLSKGKSLPEKDAIRVERQMMAELAERGLGGTRP